MPLGSLLPTGARGIVISHILLVRSYAVRAFMQLSFVTLKPTLFKVYVLDLYSSRPDVSNRSHCSIKPPSTLVSTAAGHIQPFLVSA